MEEKNIIVMLDISGTLDGITDSSAVYFIRQLTSIKSDFNAAKIKIFFSSHDMSPTGIKKYYDILKNHLTEDIDVCTSYYLNGEYDCAKEEVREYYFGYNMKKIEKLEPQLDDSVLWFGVFDDSVNPDYVKKYKEVRPMAIFRPSQCSNCEDDNIMCYSTETKGFDGVLETLEKYMIMLRQLGGNKLFEIQRNSLFRLDGTTRFFLLHKENYDLLLRYLKETNCDQGDFKNIAEWIVWNIDKSSKENLLKLREIAEVILPKLDETYQNNSDVKRKLLEKMRNINM